MPPEMAFIQKLCLCLALLGLKIWTGKAQTCITTFLEQPGGNVDVGNCSLAGSTVRIHCSLPVLGFNIIWRHTKTRSSVGTDSGTLLDVETVSEEDGCGNRTSCVYTSTTNSTKSCILIFPSFSTSENAGYYWCERSPDTSPASFVVLPSQVIQFSEPEGVEGNCSTGVYNFTSPNNNSCAYGAESLRTINIIDAVDYSLLTTTTYSPTTPEATTVKVTEAVTTKITTQAMTQQATTSNTDVAKASNLFCICWCILLYVYTLS